MTTNYESGDTVGLFVHKVQIHLTREHADAENSYQTISYRGKKQEADEVTVTVQAEKTFFQYGVDVFMFDGVTYRPNSAYRDDEWHTEGEVSLVRPDGSLPDEGHRFNPLSGYFTLGDFVDMLVSGELEPTTDPDSIWS